MGPLGRSGGGGWVGYACGGGDEEKGEAVWEVKNEWKKGRSEEKSVWARGSHWVRGGW